MTAIFILGGNCLASSALIRHFTASLMLFSSVRSSRYSSFRIDTTVSRPAPSAVALYPRYVPLGCVPKTLVPVLSTPPKIIETPKGLTPACWVYICWMSQMRLVTTSMSMGSS